MCFLVELVTVIVTGAPRADGVVLEIIEEVTEEGVTRVCPQALNYPVQLDSAAGAAVQQDNTILICGGAAEHYTYYRECFTLKNSKWKKVGGLPEQIFGQAASTIGNGKGTYI